MTDANLSRDEIQKIVAETVIATFTTLGIDAKDPFELQKDMQHLREWRQSVNKLRQQSYLTAIGVVTAGVLGLIWVAITRSN